MAIAGTRSDEPAPAPPTPVPAPRMRHIRALDGLRGVAVLAVVLYHFAPSVAPGGFLGVDLFFVLVGLPDHHACSSASSRHRAASRSARSGPGGPAGCSRALFVVLVAVGIYAVVVPEPGRRAPRPRSTASRRSSTSRTGASSRPASRTSTSSRGAVDPLRHMWSLAIEEQFYLVWPLLVFAVSGLSDVARFPRLQRDGSDRARRGVRRPRSCRSSGCSRCSNRGVAPTASTTAPTPGAFVVLIGATLGAFSAGIPDGEAPVAGAVAVIGTGSQSRSSW